MFLEEKLGKLDLIYVGLYGSKIYGLATPKSDTDVKGVYMPTKEQILLGHYKTLQFKSEELNIECEMKSVGEFLNSAKACDTNCVDMLYTPEEYWLCESKEWRDLVRLKHNLIAKNMKGLVGYIKTHAAKYSHKIDRLSELKALDDIINGMLIMRKVWTVQELIDNHDLSGFKYIRPVLFAGKKDMKEQPYLEVLGKKYIVTWSVNELSRAVKNSINDYGTRTNKGLENKQDTKALSHATRVLYQMKTWIETRDLKFPLPDVGFIMDIKMGNIADTQTIITRIDELFDECMDLLDKSDLQEETDISGMVEVICNKVFG